MTCPLQTNMDWELGLIESEKGGGMGRKLFTPENIMRHLRTIEIESGKGVSGQDACRKLGICEKTHYR